MKHKYRFCMLWLVLGLSQTLIDINASNADSLFSSGAQEQQIESDSQSARVSRAYFKQPLTGSVKVDDANNAIWASSEITWLEQPPTAAPPSGIVYGDFRERQGCAVFQSTGGLQLCFNIIPDISSLGMNAEELKLEGACTSSHAPRVRFVAAALKEDQLIARFEITCDQAVQTITLRLQPRG